MPETRPDKPIAGPVVFASVSTFRKSHVPVAGVASFAGVTGALGGSAAPGPAPRSGAKIGPTGGDAAGGGREGAEEPVSKGEAAKGGWAGAPPRVQDMGAPSSSRERGM